MGDLDLCSHHDLNPDPFQPRVINTKTQAYTGKYHAYCKPSCFLSVARFCTIADLILKVWRAVSFFLNALIFFCTPDGLPRSPCLVCMCPTPLYCLSGQHWGIVSVIRQNQETSSNDSTRTAVLKLGCKQGIRGCNVAAMANEVDRKP